MLFSFNLYKETIIKRLQECLNDVEVEIVKNIKNNGVEVMGLYLHSKTVAISPIINIEDTEGIYDVDDVEAFVERALAVFEHAAEKNRKDVSVLKNWQTISSIIRPKVVNYEKNKEQLEREMPFVKILDLAVIFVIPSKEIFPEYGEGIIRVNNNMMKDWNVTKQCLYQNAMANLKKEKYDFKNLLEYLSDIFLGNQANGNEEPTLNMLTCFNGIDGAVVLVCKKFLTEVCEKLNRRTVYILPSSIHEVLVLDVKEFEVEKLKKMVKEVNKEILDPKEFLSDNVYKFDSVTCELKIVGVTEYADENRCVVVGDIA